jgi:2-C-methyl-D-erythritol 4-phosphate cytidylyltransferase
MTASTNTPRYFALLPAAGVGARMAADGPKQYLAVGGKPMLRHAVDAFRASELIAHTYVVVSAADGQIDAVLPPDLDGVTVLRCGGASRMESVLQRPCAPCRAWLARSRYGAWCTTPRVPA